VVLYQSDIILIWSVNYRAKPYGAPWGRGLASSAARANGTDMKMVRVCQNCGASLDVSEASRYVTCQRCRTPLVVVNTGTAILTEPGDGNAAAMEQLEIRNQILQLELDWTNQRESLMLRTKRGLQEPSSVEAWLRGCFGIGVGIWLSLADSRKVPGILVVGLLFMGLGIFVIVYGTVKALRFEEASAGYRRRKGELESRLKQIDGMA
jgi:hypothetical protein